MESSAFGRLIGALISPVPTFRSLAERPGWVLAFAVVCLAPVVPGILAGPKIDWEDVVRSNFERMDMEATGEQLEAGVATWEKLGPILAYLGPLMMALGVLLFSLVLWGGFTLAGGSPGFKKSLAVTSHAMLPAVVGALLSIPVVISLERIGADQLESGSFLQSSLAAFAGEETGPVLLALLSKIDVFTIWTVVLLAIGFRFAAGVAARTATITAFVLWLLWVGVNVGFAALGTLAASAGGGG